MGEEERYDVSKCTKITFDCIEDMCRGFADKAFIEPDLADKIVKTKNDVVYLAFGGNNRITLGRDEQGELCLTTYDDYTNLWDFAINRGCDIIYISFEGGYLIKDSGLRQAKDLDDIDLEMIAETEEDNPNDIEDN